MVCPGFRSLAAAPEWQAIQSSLQRQSPSLVRPHIGQGFALLLEATSKLRKEQEQDAKLNEKERELVQNNEMLEH